MFAKHSIMWLEKNRNYSGWIKLCHGIKSMLHENVSLSLSTGKEKAINVCTTPPDATILDRSKCTSTEPDISKIADRDCNTEPCEEPYHWVVSEGVCSVTCGKGKWSNGMCYICQSFMILFDIFLSRGCLCYKKFCIILSRDSQVLIIQNCNNIP